MFRTDVIRPLVHLLRTHARDQGDRVAFRDERRQVTYSELLARTGRLAGHLVQLGVKRGDRVVLVANNRVEVIEGYLAVLRAAGVTVPVHPRSSDTELAAVLRDSGAKMVIIDTAHLDQFGRLAEQGVSVDIVLVDGSGPLSFDTLTSTEPARAARDDLGMDEVAWLLYTSGTTGQPKGVESTQRNCLWSVAACYAPVLGLSALDELLWPLPLSHSFSHILCLHGVVATGAGAHIMSGFAPTDVVELLRGDRFTFLVGVPGMYHLLAKAAAEGGVDASGLRVCMVTGAPASESLRAEFERACGVRLLDSYGSTETCGAITVSPPEERQPPGSCGRPVPGLDVRLVDHRTGREVPAGVQGEVLVRGPNVMRGYRNRPDATADAVRAGWYHTGDLAIADERGYLTITGRVREVIIRGGENLLPAEIEEVLTGLPGVAEAAVAGAPHEVLGEVPVAYLVPAAGAVIDPAEVWATCRERLAYFKVPERLYLVDELPRTTSGKVVRRALAERPATLIGQVASPAPASERTAAPVADTVELVRAEVAAVLGVPLDQVPADQPFHQLGLDSMRSVVLRDRLSAATGVPLPPTVAYDHPTPAALAARLDGGPEAVGVPTRLRAGEPIAIVAMSCRYPGGVGGPADLWRLVADEVDATGEFPTDRGWEPATDLATRRGGFLSDAAGFDPGLFGISPREATAMDPQQRILLELSWEAFERAGIAPTSVRGSPTGVFAGLMFHDYAARLTEVPDELAGYLETGTAGSVASGRIAYTLGLTGPAITVDTACSSSLVAIHLAAQALRRGECTLALAGGVAVMATPRVFEEFSRQGALAPDGRCKPFAAAADGTGWSEGAGLLLLERFSDARRNGHPVLAVLRGSAVNQDGTSNGLTAPNGPAQQRVIAAALADAGLTQDQIDAVEAHGTGTVLGDPIEAEALRAVFRRDRPLLVGSLKSNLGHTQAAAGVGGVIKMVQAMRAGTLPRSLHVDRPTPRVDWSGPVRLLTEPADWPATGEPRRAGVSSFGVSGTNAHVVIEEYRQGQPEPAPETTAVVPVPIAARTPAALRAQAGRLLAELGARPDLRPVDVGWSLAEGRAHLDHRAVLLAGHRDELRDGLAALADGGPAANVVTGAPVAGKVVFVFPGQGAQWAGMALDLLESAPVFEARMHDCDQAFRSCVTHADHSVIDALRGPLDRVDLLQPVLFSIMVSLAELMRSYGIEPDAVIGHSQGEIAAACVAGALSLADAAKVVAARGRALVPLAGHGGMVSVPLPLARVAELVRPWGQRLGVAAVNGPRSVVLSGEPGALEELLARCAADGVRAKRIPVQWASHSPQVEAVRAELVESIGAISPTTSAVPFYSTVTGDVLDTAGLDAGYWYRNLREVVQLEPAVRRALDDGHGLLVEISPHPVLGVALQETIAETAAPAIALGTLRRGENGPRAVMATVAGLHAHGATVRWHDVFAGHGARRVDLPTYAFQRKRYWLDSPAPARDVEADRFWAAARRGDVAELASTLGVEPDRSFREVVPALAQWSGRRAVEAAVDQWRYRVRWTPVADPQPVELSGTWLVVRPPGVAVDDVATALREYGAEVLESTVDEIPVGLALAGVVSLLALEVAAHPEHPAVPNGLAATLALVQAGIDAPLWVLTRGAVAVSRSDGAPDPVQAQAWGLGRVAALEYPRTWGGLVDLPARIDQRAARRLCAVLAGTGEDQVAVRPSGVFARRLERAGLRGRPPARSWRPRGTVLVTGATGGLGPHLARWLAGAGAEHLVLASRSGMPVPGLADELAALGTRVTWAACDMTERESVARMIATTGPVRAVVHAAADTELAPVAELTPAGLAGVLAAKTMGAVHLDQLLPADLDAFVLFSSVSGVWGSGNHAAYAAANAFLDTFAERRRAAGTTATSVAWGIWNSGGDRPEVLPELLRRQGLPFLPPESAVAALHQVLDHDETTVAVVDVDWRKFLPAFTIARPSRLFGAVADPVESDVDEGPGNHLAAVPAAQREDALRNLVRAHAAAVLNHPNADEIEPDRAFRELGVDSLMAVELRNRLAGATGLRLPTTLVFDHPTPAGLSRHLAAELGGAPDPAGAAAIPVPSTADDPVAIVAMACRFPGGVRSPEDLWQLLVDGTDAIGEFPTDRGWDLDRLFDLDPDRPGRSYARQGGFLYDAAEFDADLFGISPREALAMDPQQRLLLETSWEAFERAGIDPATARGRRIGVFVGASAQPYGTGLGADSVAAEAHLLTGNAASVASGRVAYAFGLEGPAVTVDTACSSSLVALRLAVQSVRQGECAAALAGGAAVMPNPAPFAGFSRQRALAADGRCKAFGAGADGMALAEGVGVVLVERLSEARRLGHPVLAVVRGSAVNSDGASNGLTAPNGSAQQRVIRQALAEAGLAASDVDVVEAHGTGTALGDPIEAGALLATYGQDRDRPVWLGSVKSNLGHTQAAAGIAGVIKMVLAMRNGLLPRTLHADEPSPHVDWSSGSMALLTEPVPWPRPRFAAVSSFGISGTNAHVILENVPREQDASEPVSSRTPIVLSGHTESAVRALAARLDGRLGSVAAARTLAVARSGGAHRAVVLADDRDGMVDGLRRVRAGRSGDPRGVAGDGRLAVLFTGQGSQWRAMGRRLYQDHPVYADAFDEVCRHLDQELDRPLREVIDEHPDLLDQTGYTQAAVFAVEVACYRLAESWGVRPDYLIGHSIGEVAAAHVAGVLSLDHACALVAARARLMQALPAGGAMVAVAAEPAEVAGEGLDIAAVNGPRSVVLSGPEQDVLAAAARWESRGREVTRLRVSHAFHSALMDPMLADFRKAVERLEFHQPRITIVSTVEGRWTADVASPEYWVRQVREPVRFADGMTWLTAHGITNFLEVGPTGALSALGRESAPQAVFAQMLRRDRETAEDAVAQLYVRGVAVDWAAFFGPAPVVDLPTYPFQRRRYWLGADSGRPAAADLRYRVEWWPVEVPSTPARGTWLVVGGGTELEPAMAGTRVVRLEPSADRVVMAQRLRAVVEPLVEPLAGVLAETDVMSTLVLLQALGDAGVSALLWCVTRGGPEAAKVAGLGRVAALEYPDRWGGVVELLAPPDGRLGGVLSGHTGEDQVRITASEVLARRLVPADLVRASGGRAWRPHGTVLITGGTGALGRRVAGWLAESGADHLLLVSRHGGTVELPAPVGGRPATKVTVVACDVADRTALAEVIKSVPDEYPLTAVVHAAGVLDDGVLDSLTPDRLVAVSRPKADGAWHLHELTAGLDLDAFVLFSAFAGTVGAAGQGGYAAANAYLDALAELRRAQGLPATAIAWGPWAGEGMAGRPDVVERLRRNGTTPLDPGMALDALAVAVRQDDGAVVVADVDWTDFAAAFTAVRPSPLLRELVDGAEPTLSELLAGTAESEVDGVLLDAVLRQVAEVLGHDATAIAPDRALRDLGLDSLAAVELRNRLSAVVGTALPTTLVFDHPTAVELAGHLRGHLAPVSAPAPVLADLQRLENSLASADEPTRAEVVARLRALVAQPAEDEDDELLTLLDEKFGIG